MSTAARGGNTWAAYFSTKAADFSTNCDSEAR